MVTGHEVCTGARVTVAQRHRSIFDFIERNRDLFPGFFHWKLEENVLPKLAVLQEFGFYPGKAGASGGTESCGAHSPKVTGQLRSDRSARSPAAAATGVL